MKLILSKKLLYFIFFTILIISCGKPPANTPIHNGLSSICSIIDTTNLFSGNTDKLKIFFIQKLQNSNGIHHFPLDSQIQINSYFDLTSDLFYSIGNNTFLLKRGFYITYVDKDMYLSFDNQNWIIIYQNPRKNRGNRFFEADYHIKYILNEEQNLLNIDYTMAVSIYDESNLPYTNINFDRQLINLTDLSGDCLFLQNDKKIDTFLTKKILFVPPKTTCNLNGSISGNLITCQGNKQIDVKFAKDIFVYSKIIPSMSFDNVNWNINLFKFRTNTKTSIIANQNQEVNYIFDWSYNYD